MIRGLTVTLLVALAIFSALLTAGGASARADYRWPRWEERDFVLSCMGKGSSGGRCVCALHWLERRYSYKRMVYIMNNRPVLLARIIDRASAAC